MGGMKVKNADANISKDTRFLSDRWPIFTRQKSLPFFYILDGTMPSLLPESPLRLSLAICFFRNTLYLSLNLSCPVKDLVGMGDFFSFSNLGFVGSGVVFNFGFFLINVF